MDLIDEILDNVKTIAVVGLSDNPARDSHGVSAYMQSQGYRIIPVNPALKGATVLGEQSYDDLSAASAAAENQGIAIDLVDVFRRSEFAGAVSDDAVSIGARYVWMQDGVVDEAAAESSWTTVSCANTNGAGAGSTAAGLSFTPPFGRPAIRLRG